MDLTPESATAVELWKAAFSTAFDETKDFARSFSLADGAIRQVDDVTRKSALGDQWAGALSHSMGGLAPGTAKEFEWCGIEIDPGPVYDAIRGVGGRVPVEETQEIVTEPHITLLAGIHPDHGVELVEVFQQNGQDMPVTLRLGGVNVFANEGEDCVYLEVMSDDLKPLRNLLRDALPNTQTFPYKPHIAICYLKPGEGAKYIGTSGLEGMEYVSHFLTYSTKEKAKKRVSLIPMSFGGLFRKGAEGMTEKSNKLDESATASAAREHVAKGNLPEQPAGADAGDLGGAVVNFPSQDELDTALNADEKRFHQFLHVADDGRQQLVTTHKNPRMYVWARSNLAGLGVNHGPNQEWTIEPKGEVETVKSPVHRVLSKKTLAAIEADPRLFVAASPWEDDEEDELEEVETIAS